MEESVSNKTEIKPKSILGSKRSKGLVSKNVNIHLNILDNKGNNIIKTEKNNKNDNLLLSKFDFNKDFMKPERKAFSIKLKNLNNINLIENKIDNLYKWENLFNNFTPVRSYISLKKPINKETNKEIKENAEYESPILLVDLPENQMNLFFRRKNAHNITSLSKDEDIKQNFNKNSHNIRPVSMYSPREENSCFYYSNTFSDYYKEDFKSFSEKFPVLKAKLKINSQKIQKELKNKDLGFINKLIILDKKRKEKTIEFNKQHLIIAGKRKNPIPLVKNVILQKYYSSNNFNENKNDKLNNENSLNYCNNKHINKFGHHLLLSYYDVNDPLISIFNKEAKNNIKNVMNNIEQTNSNKKDDNTKEYHTKEMPTKKEKKIQINKHFEEKTSKKSKSKNVKIKLKLGLFDKNINIIKDNPKSNNLYLNTKNLSTKNSINNINNTQEFTPQNTFPLKTSSDVGNTSYNKIKKFIKQKIFLKKFKFNDSILPTMVTFKTNRSYKEKNDLELILDSKKIKPKKSFSLFDSIFDKKYQQKIHYVWDKNGNLLRNGKNKKCNVIYFNQCIKNKFNNDLSSLKLNNDNNCFFPLNAFNKGNIEYYKIKNRTIISNKNNNENNKDINSIIN